MKTDVCGACIHFPLCYEVWRVEARNPCKHKHGDSFGFFRSKAELTALEAGIAAKDEALRLIWAWCEDEEVKGCLVNAAIHHSPGSDRTRKMFSDAKAARESALSPQTGKVLVDQEELGVLRSLAGVDPDKYVAVDLEKLREIERAAGGYGGLQLYAEGYCPVCRNDPAEEGHDANCWLGAFLESDGH